LIDVLGAGAALPVALALLARRRTRKPAAVWLAAALVSMSIDLINHVLLSAGVPSLPLAQVAYPLGFAHVPLLYLYVRAMLGQPPLSRAALALHALPFLVMLALCARVATVGWFYAHLGRYTERVFETLQQLQQFCYALAIYRNYRRHRADVASEYATLDGRVQLWMRNFAVGVAVLAGAAFVNSASGRHVLHDLYFGTALLLLYIAYVGLADPVVFALEQRVAPTKAPLGPDQAPKLKQLLDLMTTERPYLDSTLTLTKLARRAGLGRTELSALINNGLGRNFFDFVNEYRVAAARQQLCERPDVGILDVAFAVGFNSKSTFYAAWGRFEKGSPARLKKPSR
jgi:AraC-like DNA-binding protein